MEKIMKEDFDKLNNDFFYVAKRKFNVDLYNDITSVYISDVLISLYFEGQRTNSNIAISLVGSFVGNTVIKEWGGQWAPNSFSVKGVGLNKIVVNPFSISHQRLTKGVNKTLFNQLQSVGIKANNEDINLKLDENRLREVFNKLFEDGWWPISKIYKKNYPNYVRYEMAYIVGVMAKYLKDKDYVKQKFSELLEDKDMIYYACVVFQNCLFPDFWDKIKEIIEGKDYSNSVKAQAINALLGLSNDDKLKILDFIYGLIFKIHNPVLKLYAGNLIGTINSEDNIRWINEKLLDNNTDELTKLALLVSVQILRKKEFNKTLLSLFFDNNISNSFKDEIIKTLHLLPISDEIYQIRDHYDKFDMKNKIGFINIVLFSDFKNKKELLKDLLNHENDSFVKGYILSAIDNISS